MFERYTERARRVIFFSRCEASQFGVDYMEPEHLLLALLREDPALRAHFVRKQIRRGEIRRRIETRTPPRALNNSISIEFSAGLKNVLLCASEEARGLEQNRIDSGHLVLALLHDAGSFPGSLLREFGVQYERYREIVRNTEEPVDRARITFVRRDQESALEEDAIPPSADALAPIIGRLRHILVTAAAYLHTDSESYELGRLARKPWMRKQALGHLVNLAATHHYWFTRALVEPKLTALIPVDESCIEEQHFEEFSWRQLVDLWFLSNRLLIHLLTKFPESKLQVQCRIGVTESMTFIELVETYVDSVEDLTAQVLSLL